MTTQPRRRRGYARRERLIIAATRELAEAEGWDGGPARKSGKKDETRARRNAVRPGLLFGLKGQLRPHRYGGDGWARGAAGELLGSRVGAEHRLHCGGDGWARVQLDQAGSSGQGAGLAVAEALPVALLVALASAQRAAEGEAGRAGKCEEEEQCEGCHGMFLPSN